MVDQILAALSNPMVITVVTFLFSEVLMRFVKTDKPLSWMHVASGILRSAALVCQGVADFLDKVLPQKLN